MQFRLFFLCLLLVSVRFSFAIAGEPNTVESYELAEAAILSSEDEGSADDLESRIARELVATGQMADGDPQFDSVVAKLREQGLSAIQGGEPVTENWIREQLQAILPQFENASANAAAFAAVQEISKGAGKASDSLIGEALYLTGDGGTFGGHDVTVNAAKETLWRSGLEGLRAAASASDIYALTHLEMEYSLSEGGLDEYALLTVQPLYESADMRHTLFAQLSYANAEINDSGAGTSDRRDTVNGGLAYRYITPDEQHMFGANAFFDHQWPYHHNRMSLGVDYKTSLIGAHLNHYIGLSDWRSRGDGYEEKALSGTDLTLSGRLPQAPELELFVRGFHWDQDKTARLNPDGDDIWGYALAAEYTPVNVLTLRGEVEKDNDIDEVQGTATVRLNYNFGQRLEDLFARPSYNLSSVTERRFDKVRRINEIRVQVRRNAFLGLPICPGGDLSAPANAGCARLFGEDPNNINDVMVYAGDVPGTTTDFFVRRCDVGMTWNGTACIGARSYLQWKNSNTNSDTASLIGVETWTDSSARDGPNNTNTLVLDGSGIHEAAETCAALPGGGWYLPGLSELDVIYANLVATDDPDHPLSTVNNSTDDDNSGTRGPLRSGFDTSGSWYWSSSERSSSRAWMQRLSDGNQNNSVKTVDRLVRCVRRE